MKNLISPALRPVLFPAVLWLCAFVCALYPINAHQMEFFGGSIVFLFSWAYVMLARGIQTGWNLPRTPVLWIAGAFWILVLLSVFWSDVKSASIMGLCIFSALPLSFFIGSMAGEKPYFKMMSYSLAVIFAVLSVWAVVQFFFLNAYFNGQARHPLADPSSLGALFSLALFCAMGWMLYAKGAGERGCATVLAVLLICGIMSTVSRGPVFAFLPGLFLFLILLWPHIKIRWKSFVLLIAAVAAFYGLMQIHGQKTFDVGHRIASTVTFADDNIDSNRLMLWKSTAAMIKDHPWLGTGIGTFFLNYPPYRDPANPDTSYLAHNDPLQFWAELGIAGPVLFYLFVMAAAVRSFRALNKNKTLGNLNDRLLIAVTLCALTSMVVQSHVSFCHYNLSLLLMAGFLLSIWFQASVRALEEETIVYSMPSQSPVFLSKVLLALPFLMLAWLNLSIVVGEAFINRARDHLLKGDLPAFASDINSAGRVSMGMNYRAYLLAVNVPLTDLELGKDSLSIKEQRELYDQVIDYMYRVLAKNPHSGPAYYYLALVQEKVKEAAIPQDASAPKALYEEALRLEPTYLAARLAFDQWLERHKFEKSTRLKMLEEGVAFDYADPLARDYYARMASLYLETKNYVKMNEILAKAAAFEKRSAYSARRQATTLPQAVMGGDDILRRP